jgi:GTP cyclohydrolase I
MVVARTLTQENDVKLTDWLAEHVTDDPRALQWFDAAEAEGRIIRCYKELLSGYTVDPSKILKTTRTVKPNEQTATVQVDNIAFYSICAHHFLPFFGNVSITYVPGDRILGLGKLPRLVDAYARRFQIQEDLVRDVAREMMESGHARGVRVKSEARHLCMISRGPQSPDALTRTEIALGCLDDGNA